MTLSTASFCPLDQARAGKDHREFRDFSIELNWRHRKWIVRRDDATRPARLQSLAGHNEAGVVGLVHLKILWCPPPSVNREVIPQMIYIRQGIKSLAKVHAPRR